MKHDVKALVDHLSGRSLCRTDLTGADLLEQLWYCYLEENSADPQEIRDGFRDVDKLLEPLPFASANQLFDIVSRQCCRYQRQAFLDGLTLGARLHQTLTAEN